MSNSSPRSVGASSAADLWINNAGIAIGGATDALSLADWLCALIACGGGSKGTPTNTSTSAVKSGD